MEGFRQRFTMRSIIDLPASHPGATAALVAGLAALPSLWLPFLADDWINLTAVANGQFWRTPFGYFRPAYLATYWLDRVLWGLNPTLFHLTSLLLIAAAAWLTVAVAQRYAGRPDLAYLAGILFALQPYHFTNAAWIAARADPLCAVLALCATLSHDSWRQTRRGLPLTTLLLFEGSLLAKEASAGLPIVLTLLAFCTRRPRPRTREWLCGYLPLYAVALAHFLVFRPIALGELGLSRLTGANTTWAWNFLGFCTASLLPAPIDILEGNPRAWGLLGGGGVVAIWLLVTNRPTSRTVSPAVVLAAASFVILLLPSLISFQDRFLFCPSIASSMALAGVLIAIKPSIRRPVLVSFVVALLIGLSWQWDAWHDAGAASQAVVDGLVRASNRRGVQEVVLANLPYRVHGPPVVGDFEAAILLSGGRQIGVKAATSIDYPSAWIETLDPPIDTAVRVTDSYAEVRLRVIQGLFSRLDDPPLSPAVRARETPWANVSALSDGSLLVRIPKTIDGSRAAYYWRQGHLDLLF